MRDNFDRLPHATHLYDTSPARLGAAAVAILTLVVFWGLFLLVIWWWA